MTKSKASHEIKAAKFKKQEQRRKTAEGEVKKQAKETNKEMKQSKDASSDMFAPSPPPAGNSSDMSHKRKREILDDEDGGVLLPKEGGDDAFATGEGFVSLSGGKKKKPKKSKKAGDGDGVTTSVQTEDVNSDSKLASKDVTMSDIQPVTEKLNANGVKDDTHAESEPNKKEKKRKQKDSEAVADDESSTTVAVDVAEPAANDDDSTKKKKKKKDKAAKEAVTDTVDKPETTATGDVQIDGEPSEKKKKEKKVRKDKATKAAADVESAVEPEPSQTEAVVDALLEKLDATAAAETNADAQPKSHMSKWTKERKPKKSKKKDAEANTTPAAYVAPTEVLSPEAKAAQKKARYERKLKEREEAKQMGVTIKEYYRLKASGDMPAGEEATIDGSDAAVDALIEDAKADAGKDANEDSTAKASNAAPRAPQPDQEKVFASQSKKNKKSKNKPNDSKNATAELNEAEDGSESEKKPAKTLTPEQQAKRTAENKKRKQRRNNAQLLKKEKAEAGGVSLAAQTDGANDEKDESGVHPDRMRLVKF